MPVEFVIVRMRLETRVDGREYGCVMRSFEVLKFVMAEGLEHTVSQAGVHVRKLRKVLRLITPCARMLQIQRQLLDVSCTGTSRNSDVSPFSRSRLRTPRYML
jgi:hypothetical protein